MAVFPESVAGHTLSAAQPEVGGGGEEHWPDALSHEPEGEQARVMEGPEGQGREAVCPAGVEGHCPSAGHAFEGVAEKEKEIREGQGQREREWKRDMRE